LSYGSFCRESFTDSLKTSELLAERLQAWKHAVGYIENYVSATEKLEKAHAKEYEKVLKVRRRL
jgi:DNA-binding PucR family transcriptional regulator